jgi:hypothetical protein
MYQNEIELEEQLQKEFEKLAQASNLNLVKCELADGIKTYNHYNTLQCYLLYKAGRMNACLDSFNNQNKAQDNSMSEYERQLAKLLECAKIEFQNAKSARFSLEELRSDLAYQFRTPDELDWDYLLDTVIRA